MSQWGVDLIQGFYFSRPLSEKALLEALGKTDVSAQAACPALP